jgi:sporulation protein YlmC with PRC-barrel domain
MNKSYAPYFSSGIFLATALAAAPLVAEQNPTFPEADRAGAYQAQESEAERALRGTGITATEGSERIGSVEVDDIVGKDVVDQTNDKIGEIQEIVRHQQSQDLHAVVSVGGFMGMGEKEVTIPLRDLQVSDDEIRAPQFATTEDQLNALPEYDESMYQEVDEDSRIDQAEFAAFESDDD